ncbi:hypothetical protein ABN303_12635 [Providencia rettgeri]
MELNTQANNIKKSPSCMGNKKITSKNLSFTERVNFIRPVNTGGYKKVNFAIKTCEFYNREQPELNQLSYSQPVQKITLPYKHHEKTKLTQECQEHYLLLHAPPILNDSTTIKSDSFINKKKDNPLMPVHKTNVPEVKSINNFRLNRSANKLSKFIFEIKSIQEKSTRYLKNIFRKNNNEELCVKFENGEAKITDKATIARQELMKQHKEINHTEKENSAIDLEWDYFEQEPTYLDNRSAVFPHQKNESLNFESNNTDEFNDLITVLYSSDESLNSSGYHSDTSLPLRSSEYSSTESLHQENDNLNPNIDLIINNPTKYYNLTNFNSNNEILKYSSSESLHQKKYNKENFSDINKRPEKQTQTEKMKLLTEGKSSTGYIHPSRREESNSNKI